MNKEKSDSLAPSYYCLTSAQKCIKALQQTNPAHGMVRPLFPLYLKAFPIFMCVLHTIKVQSETVIQSGLLGQSYPLF